MDHDLAWLARTSARLDIGKPFAQAHKHANRLRLKS